MASASAVKVHPVNTSATATAKEEQQVAEEGADEDGNCSISSNTSFAVEEFIPAAGEVDLEVQQQNGNWLDAAAAEELLSRDNQVISAAAANLKASSLPRCNTDQEFNKRMQPYHQQQHQKQSYSRRELAALAFQTLGVVYGDMGTSPLYVYSSTALHDPQTADFLGALSIMFWTLTLIALVKYVFLVLRADDHGEGGSFAVYSKLCQHARIGQTAGAPYTPLQSDAQLSYHTSKRKARPGWVHARVQGMLEGSKAAQRALLGLVMLGTSMIIGDGVLTPVISVMSAVGGLKSSSSGEGGGVSQSSVAMVSAAILLVLFVCQRLGTSKVATFFSPIMLAWFVMIFSTGVYNVVRYHPGVLKGLSPHYALMFFQRNGYHGWRAMSGLVLVITGSEAMFWDLGHFNRQAIQLAFTCVVYPALVLTYAGQTAFLIAKPESIGNAFYDCVPPGLHWPVLLVSTLAAIVASQALISATFCVFKQAVALGCLPRVQIRHTSDRQVYCPLANWMLTVLCLAVVFGFRDQTKIADAYGVPVLFDLVITTCLVTLVMLLVWRTAWPAALAFFVGFIALEGAYLSSVLVKIAHGGWVPFGIAGVFMSVMVVWNLGRRMKHDYEVRHRPSPERMREMLDSIPAVRRVPGMCFFYSELPDGPSPVFEHYVHKNGSLHQVLVFVTVRFVPVKHVPDSERYLVGKVGCGRGVYRCVARYGYKDVVDVAEKGFMFQVRVCLEDYLASHGGQTISETEQGDEMAELQAAAESRAVYVIGKSRLEVTTGAAPGCNLNLVSRMGNWALRFVANHLYYVLQHNCRSAVEEMEVPHSNLLEVRMVYDCKL